MTGISFVIGQDTATPALAELIARAGDLKPLMEEFGSYLVADTQIRFEREQAPDGSVWPKSIRAQIQGGATLRDKGHLVQSIVHKASSHQVEVGTAKEQAALLHFGGTITAKNKPYLTFKIGGHFIRKKSVTIPARPFLGISATNENVLLEIAGDWFRGAA